MQRGLWTKCLSEIWLAVLEAQSNPLWRKCVNVTMLSEQKNLVQSATIRSNTTVIWCEGARMTAPWMSRIDTKGGRLTATANFSTPHSVGNRQQSRTNVPSVVRGLLILPRIGEFCLAERNTGHKVLKHTCKIGKVMKKLFCGMQQGGICAYLSTLVVSLL